MPCKPTKTNGGRTRNLPHHEPEKWELFKEYCKQDVVTEMAVKNHLHHELPISEQMLWIIDQHINAGGVRVDVDLIRGALSIDEEITTELTDLSLIHI